MAMKVKGITIELSADTSGLEAALKGINKSLSQTQKDLRDVDKALKLDPANVELIEQKQRLLAKATEEATNKLKALKEAQDNLKDRSSDDGQRQYDALTREISGTEQKLKALNEEQAKFAQEQAEAQQQASGFGSALSKVATGADKVAQNTAAMSAAAATALGGLVAMTVQASNFADNMLTASQQTGLSTDALQQMNYAAQRIDVPMETIISSVQKMKGHLDDSSGVWEKLGVQVRDQAGNYRDIEDIFYDTVKALGEIENGTERDTLAMDVFGRSADELAGILDDGGQKLRALGQEASSIGGIIPEGDLQTLGNFNDRLEEMKSKLQVIAVQAAVPIAEALMPGLEALANVVTTVAQALSNANPLIIQIGVVLLALLAAISPVAKAIANLSNAFMGIVQIAPYVKTGIDLISGALTSFLSNPYALMIMAIVAAIALLAVGIYEVVKHWDEIKAAASDALGSMSSGLQSAQESIYSFAESIGSGIQSGFETAKSIVSDFIGKVGELTGLSDIIDAVGGAFGQLADAIGSAVDNALSILDDLAGSAAEAGANVIDGFVSGVKSVISSVQQAFQQLANAISNVWSAIQGEAQQAGQGTAAAFANGVASGPRAQIQAPTYGGGGGGSRGGGGFSSLSSFGDGQLLSAVNTLNNNIVAMGSSPTNVNVTLSGSAKNIFDTVRVQNTKLQTATGYHALA